MIWWTALLFGFLGSVHCIGMCGPIALSLPVYGPSYPAAIGRLLIYNLGRTLSYSLLGTILGLAGFSIHYFGWQQWFSVGIGILLLISLVFSYHPENMLLGWKPFKSYFSKMQLFLAHWMSSKKPFRYLMTGIANGFLPCGLVYMAVAGALTTASAAQGALYMALFGVGTIPAMLSVSLIGHNLKQSMRGKIQKLIPVIIFIFAILFILRGLNLGIRYISPANPSQIPAMEQCD